MDFAFNLKIKRLNEKAIVPSRGSKTAAGYDLYACLEKNDEMWISPHSTMLIGTGWAMEIPTGYFGAIVARSGLATKQGLRPANCIGVIDSDYRGEIKIALHNDTDEMQMITDGERVAQLVIIPFANFIGFSEVEDLQNTERGENGFGSTGIN